MLLSRHYKLVRKFSKIALLGLRPSRAIGRLVGPKLILNSIPKCGTNLVLEIIHRFPKMHGKVAPTISDKMGEKVLARVAAISKGQCVPAHLFYSKEVERVMAENDIKMIFVIRDFRDAILSHINYIDKIHVGHAHHEVFSRFSSMDEKIDACLSGIDGTFKSWPELVDGFKGWMTSDRVMLVRYENLIGDKDEAKALIKKMASFLGVGSINAERIFHSMFDKGGPTFNAPGVGKWKKAFSQGQIVKINDVMGERLAMFGYQV